MRAKSRGARQAIPNQTVKVANQKALSEPLQALLTYQGLSEPFKQTLRGTRMNPETPISLDCGIYSLNHIRDPTIN